jgi:hypothetical protein
MALFVLVAVAAAMDEWKPHRADAYVMPVVLLVTFVIHYYAGLMPYNVCCSARGFDATRRQFEQLAQREDIARATVANPDLGVMSWYKQFNIVDLGYLGSAVTARLAGEPAAMRTYVLDYAAPDLLESHGWWSCRHVAFLAGPAFRERYVFVDGSARTPTISCQGGEAAQGLWIRRDVMRGARSPERLLMDDLARAPSVERVERELAACRSRGGVATACAYVARSVYRVLPEFRARGLAPALERIFESSPSREFDLFLVRGASDARAYRALLDRLLNEGAAR